MGLILALIAGFAVIMATSQPAPRDMVVLLPDQDGKVGAIVVATSRGETVLNSAYAVARSAPGGAVRAETASESEVRETFAGALAAQPPRPVSFTLYFESGSDQFTAQSKQEVQQLLAEMARRPAPEITVIGHTDSVGNDATNDALALLRAGRVKTLLVEMGIAAERIQIASRGKREPLVATPEGVAEPRNRRVEISVR